MDGGRDGGREGGREEGGSKGGREGGSERGREGGMEGWWEGVRDGVLIRYSIMNQNQKHLFCISMLICALFCLITKLTQCNEINYPVAPFHVSN